MALEVLAFQGRVGDHNELAIPGARAVAARMGAQLGLEVACVGAPVVQPDAGWAVELEHARPALEQLRAHFERLYAVGAKVAAATSRCAASIATLPVVARHRPDACVVWFDAHADLNTPESSLTGYLGGLALSAPLGLWDSGLGAGLATENVILVGQRDLDPYEAELMRLLSIRCVPPGPGLVAALAGALDGRPAYVHLDCDVLDPGIVPTDYVHDGGLSLADLQQCARLLARSEVVGLEVAEFQCAWTPGGPPVSSAPLIDALYPLLAALQERH
jgi:arginase family enzyme